MAVAATGGNRSQQGRGVRNKPERAGQKNDSEEEESAERVQPKNCVVEELLHGGIVAENVEKNR
jgi:hypothetical protein